MSAGIPVWVQILSGTLPLIAFWSGWFLGCAEGRSREKHEQRIRAWADVANRAFSNLRNEEGE